jgi:hypothetical protein
VPALRKRLSGAAKGKMAVDYTTDEGQKELGYEIRSDRGESVLPRYGQRNYWNAKPGKPQMQGYSPFRRISEFQTE